MSAPLRVINQAVNLCPAVTAAVAAIHIFVADSFCHISKCRSVAEAVACTVNKHIVCVDYRPIASVIMRDSRIEFLVSILCIVKASLKLLRFAHTFIGNLCNYLQGSEKSFVGFCFNPCCLAAHYIPVFTVLSNTVTVRKINFAVLIGIVPTVLVRTYDTVFLKNTGCIVVIFISVNRLHTCTQNTLVKGQFFTVYCDCTVGKYSVAIILCIINI